jgi:hypothetical protein
MAISHRKSRALSRVLRNVLRADTAEVHEPVKQGAVAAGATGAPAYSLSVDIPKSYDDTYIRAIPKDPENTFVYWEMPKEKAETGVFPDKGTAHVNNQEVARVQEQLNHSANSSNVNNNVNNNNVTNNNASNNNQHAHHKQHDTNNQQWLNDNSHWLNNTKRWEGDNQWRQGSDASNFNDAGNVNNTSNVGNVGNVGNVSNTNNASNFNDASNTNNISNFNHACNVINTNNISNINNANNARAAFTDTDPLTYMLNSLIAECGQYIDSGGTRPGHRRPSPNFSSGVFYSSGGGKQVQG